MKRERFRKVRKGAASKQLVEADGSSSREAEVQWMKSVPCSGRESLQTRCAKFGDINLKKPRVPSAGEEMLLRTLPPRCLKGMIETGKDTFLG